MSDHPHIVLWGHYLGMKKALYVLYLIVLSFIAFLFSGYFLLSPGTNILNVDVGLMTWAKAQSVLEDKIDWDSATVKLQTDGTHITMRLKDLGVMPDFRRSLAAARRSFFQHGYKNVPLKVSLQEDIFEKASAEIETQVKKAPLDAEFLIKEGRVSIAPHKLGRILDRENFRLLLMEDIEGLLNVIVLPFITVDPEISTKSLESYPPLSLVSNFSTSFVDSNDRGHNIKLAGEKFRVYTVWPSETFSFNEITGERSPKNGYRKAPVMMDGRLVDDYGGGVCQVSSTLYVAALKANFSIVERHNHGLPVSYIPMGLDATVSYGFLDLKMKNPHKTPYVIHCETKEGVLSFSLFGNVTGETVSIESRCLGEYPGENGTDPETYRSRYLVETFRKSVKVDGSEYLERLNTSMYLCETPLRQNIPPKLN